MLGSCNEDFPVVVRPNQQTIAETAIRPATCRRLVQDIPRHQGSCAAGCPGQVRSGRQFVVDGCQPCRISARPRRRHQIDHRGERRDRERTRRQNRRQIEPDLLLSCAACDTICPAVNTGRRVRCSRQVRRQRARQDPGRRQSRRGISVHRRPVTIEGPGLNLVRRRSGLRPLQLLQSRQDQPSTCRLVQGVDVRL